MDKIEGENDAIEHARQYFDMQKRIVEIKSQLTQYFVENEMSHMFNVNWRRVYREYVRGTIRR